MSKMKVAVCDVDEDYRGRFVTYLMEHRREEMEIHAFSVPEVFENVLEGAVFGLVFLGSGFVELVDKIQKRKIPLLILSEEMPQAVEETVTYGMQEIILTATVFKYQPMESILHEMKSLTGGMEAFYAKSARPERLEVIGVYSPVNHEMQMPFSLIFANEIAEERKVLYINLMEYSGFLELFSLSSEYDLGDVVMRVRKNRLLPEIFMRGIYEVGRVSYVPPFSNPENLTEFTTEDFFKLLSFLEEKTPFETVVFDFGQGLSKLPRMLEACSSVYCPMKAGYFYECRQGQFVNYISQVLGTELEQKLHFVNLPFTAKGICGGGSTFERLLWSEFGDYVRAYKIGGER